MRGPTINPNPPICKSKEPSFTYIRIFSCIDDHLITEIAHYNWNLTQAQTAANGGTGTYTEGYFYEAAFKKTSDLGQNHCLSFNYISVEGVGGMLGTANIRENIYQSSTDLGHSHSFDTPLFDADPFETWTLELLEFTYLPNRAYEGIYRIHAGSEEDMETQIFGGQGERGHGSTPPPYTLNLALPSPPTPWN